MKKVTYRDMGDMIMEVRRVKAKAMWNMFIRVLRECGYDTAFRMVTGYRKGSFLFGFGLVPRIHNPILREFISNEKNAEKEALKNQFINEMVRDPSGKF